MFRIIITLLFLAVFAQIAGCNNQTPPDETCEDDIAALHKNYTEKFKEARSKTCKSYLTRDDEQVSHSYAIHIINERAANRTSSSALNNPLEKHADVLCALEPREGFAAFIPNLSENAGHTIRYPGDSEKLSHVIDALRAGFILGHPIVGLMLASNHHQIMGAFKDDGEFYIVDSMSGGLINVQDFSALLNQAKILNKKGFPIKFFGKSIGTRLQKGGNDCTRLAALYLRQIIKDNDLDAYQKVNGAFVDDILHRFEDIARIDDARKIAVVDPSIDQQRDQFMRSWDHRNYGLLHDGGWQGIKLGDLRPISQGGKESDKEKYELWTNFNNGLWNSKLRHHCESGIRFCLDRDRRRDKPVFQDRFDTLAILYTDANNPANPRVTRLTNFNETLEHILDAHHARQGLLYLRETNEFFKIQLDNAFTKL